MGHTANNGLKSTVKLFAACMAVLMLSVAAWAGRVAIRTTNEGNDRMRLVYVVKDEAGNWIRTIREVVSPGNQARVVLRKIPRGTYTVTPYAWASLGAWRSSQPLAVGREVSIGRGVETVDFTIAGNGGGGGNGEVQGWPNGIVWMNSTGSPFALPYSMRHPTLTGGVSQNFTFDAVVASGAAGFNSAIGTTSLMGWSGTINVNTGGAGTNVPFAENLGVMIDPTTRVVEIANVNGVLVARAPANPVGKQENFFYEFPPEFVGSAE